MLSADEITRRLLAHFGTEDGWSPDDEWYCHCTSCCESCGCEVPGIFEALGLPVPEATAPPREARVEASLKVDMSGLMKLEPTRSKLFEMVSKLQDTSVYRHTTLPFVAASDAT